MLLANRIWILSAMVELLLCKPPWRQNGEKDSGLEIMNYHREAAPGVLVDLKKNKKKKNKKPGDLMAAAARLCTCGRRPIMCPQHRIQLEHPWTHGDRS